MFPEIRYFALRAPAGGRLLKFPRLTFGPRPFLGNLIGRPPFREEIERGDGAPRRRGWRVTPNGPGNVK